MEDTFYCPFCDKEIPAFMKDYGHKAECFYCGLLVPCGPVPKVNDDEGWAEATKFHREGCKWVGSRGRRISGKR